MIKPDIDNCPFCEGKAYLDGRSDDVCVRCTVCHASGKMFFFDSENFEEIDAAELEAINYWNCRRQFAIVNAALQSAKSAFDILRPSCKDGADFADVIDAVMPSINNALKDSTKQKDDYLWVSYKEGVIWNVGLTMEQVSTNAEIIRLYHYIQMDFSDTKE